MLSGFTLLGVRSLATRLRWPRISLKENGRTFSDFLVQRQREASGQPAAGLHIFCGATLPVSTTARRLALGWVHCRSYTLTSDSPSFHAAQDFAGHATEAYTQSPFAYGRPSSDDSALSRNTMAQEASFAKPPVPFRIASASA